MEIIKIIAVCITFILGLGIIYIWIRNVKTYEFLTDVSDLLINKFHRMGVYDEIYINNKFDEYTLNRYDDILWSFKSLKLKNFYTEEEINWLMNEEY